MLDATMRVVGSNFVVHQVNALVSIAFKTVQPLYSAKLQTFIYLSYSHVMVQTSTSLTTGFRESYIQQAALA